MPSPASERASGATNPPGSALPRPGTPEDALRRLQEGNQRFVAGAPLHPNQSLELRRQLAGSQQPFAAVLGCSDSRTSPELAMDAGIGDLFVCRVAGNIATPEEAASLLYSQAVLGTDVILVLGHDNCGAVKAAIEVADGKMPPGEFGPLTEPIRPAVAEARRFGATGDALLHEAVTANVRLVVEALPRMSTGLAQAVRSGELTIHGGVLTLATGKIDMLS
ncbi:carbonic anhydrase [Saccharopolyspora erythraea]|uniref:carbonic anhydrase n=1 Tax=Saccharopolyspora erythraea TaxID=1836 RepID=UPI001BA5DEF6|nr:carbonic anhydrase [Saccharopolyspora erythraea]QUG99602.1 carbonic anhydrase [Saccharopolyspora erythraea]